MSLGWEQTIELRCMGRQVSLPLWLGGIRIQPTFALVRVVREDESWDINCPIPPAYCMLNLLAYSKR